jgi:hypothetical protein
MPCVAAPIGTSWAIGSWSDTAWCEDTWAGTPCTAAPIGAVWASGSWEVVWCADTWAGGVTPPPSAGNYVQRVIGRTTRAEDFIRVERIDPNVLRRKREDEEIIIL